MTIANRTLTLLNIRPDEARMATVVASFFAIIELGRNIGANTVDALFFHRFGVDNLPYMYIVLGVVTFFVSLLYAGYLGRTNNRRYFTWLLIGMGLVLLIEWGLTFLDFRELYPVLWISAKIIASLLGTMVWNTAGDVVEPHQAKRLFPIFVSAGILGGLVGSVIMGPAARLLGTENLLVIYVLLLGVALALVRSISSFQKQQAKHPEGSSNLMTDIRTSFDYVRQSPLLMRLAVSAVLFSMLFFSVSFPFGKASAAAFSNEADLAGFLGLFNGITSALMFIAALLIANRLYARIGIVLALLILPITYLLGFALFMVDFSIITAVIVRLTQSVILSGIGDGAYSSFFNVVPPEKRAQVRAFDSAVPSQVGTVLSGVLLILGERVLNNTEIFLMGIVIAAACGLVVWQMRKSYGDALIAALRAGRVDVFTTGERIFAGLQQDATAIRLMIAALDDPRPTTQQLAAEVLGRMRALSAVPALLQRLNQTTGENRAGIVRSLGEIGDRRAAEPVATLLADPSAPIRAAALEALPKLYSPGNPDVQRLIQPLGDDPDLIVRSRALVSLGIQGADETARRSLVDLLQKGGAEQRLSVLQAIHNSPGGSLPAQRINQLALLDAAGACLRDASASVREAACLALSDGGVDEGGLQALAGCLSDGDPAVRAAAAQALKANGPAASPYALAVLQGHARIDHSEVLDAFAPDDLTLREPLRRLAQDEIDRLTLLRQLSSSIPQSGRAAGFLASVLKKKAATHEQRLVKLVGLLGNQEAMTLVGKSLESGDSQTRSAALEALDVLGDKALVKALLPLLEESAQGAATGSPTSQKFDQSLDWFISQEDRWLQALALRAAGELRLAARKPDLDRFANHADELIKGAAQDALAQLGGKMETLATLSLIERVLLLKEIPLFCDLSPDDLGRIALISSERWFSNGDALCREGDPGNEMFVIASGKVRVLRGPAGHEKLLATREMGEFVGEMSIIDAVPRFATVIADGEVRALVIGSNAFTSILRDRPEVSLGVMRGLSRRLRELG